MPSLSEYTDVDRRMIWANAYMSISAKLTKGMIISALILYIPLLSQTFWNFLKEGWLFIPIITLCILGYFITCRNILNNFRVSNTPYNYDNNDLSDMRLKLWIYIGFIALGISQLYDYWIVYHTIYAFFILITMINIISLMKSFDDMDEPVPAIIIYVLIILGAFIIDIPFSNLTNTDSITQVSYFSFLIYYIFASIDTILNNEEMILNPDAHIFASIYPLLRPVASIMSLCGIQFDFQYKNKK
jgi:hypothetical protein